MAKSQPTQSGGGADVDALIAEVEACCPPDVVSKAHATAGTGQGAGAMPPGWEDLAMQVFLFLLNWWKARKP